MLTPIVGMVEGDYPIESVILGGLESLLDMTWAIPLHNRRRVDAAGEILVRPPMLSSHEDFETSLVIMNNWRSAHSYPLQCLKMGLLEKAKGIDGTAVIAQRLKRLSSISLKLNLHSHMKLSQMQDIGGCRSVMRDVQKVHELARKYETSKAKNPKRGAEFVKKYDYIRNPKTDGYRSVHLVYKYLSNSEKHNMYNGLRIEIQLRSRLQHAWATAVETASTFTGQALKSNIGEETWKRFFALMGSAIALREKQPLVPGTPHNKGDLAKEIKVLVDELKIEAVLRGWGFAVKLLKDKLRDAYAYLLILDIKANTISVQGFQRRELPNASERYLLVEKETAGKPEVQAVLVSVSSMAALQRAYPNYFLDSTAFLEAVRHATTT